VSAVTPPYEPEVIERFAAQLDARARALQRGITLTGAILGGFVGAVPLTPLGEAWPIPGVFGFATLLAGVLAGSLIGFVVGSGRAELHRLHAQTVLCQLHAQRATLAIWKLLRDQQQERERVPAAAPVAAPPPVLPAPVAPATVAPALVVTPPLPPPAPEPPLVAEAPAAPASPAVPPLTQQVAPPPLSIRSA
jgi:hypothetical protein